MRYAALLIIGLAGCSNPYLNPQGHANAMYVRDKSHHCEGSITNPMKTIDISGKVQYIGGWTTWRCDDGISIVIDRDEEQP
jgi:hypothetical protein